MPMIKMIEHDGTEHTLDADVGQSVMQIAVNNMVSGIIGQCGGNCSCATCHVYVDPQWLSCLAAPGLDERDLIDCVAQPRENSRLGCQIRMTPELDGLVVRLPETQD